MKYIWEEEDIKCGRFVYRKGGNYSTAYKIGFASWVKNGKKKGEGHYVLIAITDGMVTMPVTKKEMVKSFNETNKAPLPFEKLNEFITHLRCQGEGSYDQ